jgi:hypothetical protein
MPKSKRKSKKQQNREKRDFAETASAVFQQAMGNKHLGRAHRRSVILAQVGVDNVILVRPSLGL